MPVFFTGAGCSSGVVPNPQPRQACSSLCSLRTHAQEMLPRRSTGRAPCMLCLAPNFLAVPIPSLMTTQDVMDTFCGSFPLKKKSRNTMEIHIYIKSFWAIHRLIYSPDWLILVCHALLQNYACVFFHNHGCRPWLKIWFYLFYSEIVPIT